MVVFGRKRLYSVKIRYIPVKVVVIGQIGYIWVKVVGSGKSGCVRAKVAVFG